MAQRQTITVKAGSKSSGEPVFERLLVDRLDDGGYRLVASPGLYLGAAAGDVIEVDQQDSEPTVRERGGNVCVHVYGAPDAVDLLIPRIERLGGFADGRLKDLTVFTVPVTAGFARIENVLNAFVAQLPEIEWYYGNVYNPEDGVTPLKWWAE